ncbi:MAG TPA: metallophosphoesterase [Actinomycetota bacterium]|nr:metallophosphoesterase [Actinomycetota bacterium]
MPAVRVRRSWAPVAAAGFLGAVLSYLVLGLLPPVRHDAGPATLETRFSAGWGDTVLQVPPLGTVSADSHTAPVALRVSLVEVDVTRLARRVGDAAARAQLTRDVEADLRDLAPRLLLQFCAGAVLVGAATGALLPRRRPAYMVAGAAGALVLTGFLLGGSALSYDVDAFEQPRFTGALVRAPVVIEALQGGEITFERLQSRYETAADRLSELLALVAQPNQDPAADSVAVLHVSDIHSNPLGVQLARQLAARFGVDAVLDTGDLTNFGIAAEARIGRLIARIPVPYYLVPGNHDSAANEAQLDRIENLTVLDGDIAEIEGIRVLGWGDPTDTNWNRIPPDEAAEIRAEEGEDTAVAVRSALPDVLAVHDRRLAEASFGDVPLVLAGHYHKRIEEEVEGTRVLSVGSTGATGFKFFVEAARDYEAEIVYFRGSDAIAVDYVRFSGLGSDFEIERKTFDPVEPE